MTIDAEVEKLGRLATAAAEAHADTLAALSEAIREAPNRGADCQLLLGVLLEGIVFTVTRKLPPEQQAETGLAVVRILLTRLNATQRS